MKIAQVSPLYESVPPRLYGGSERIVSYLTEELIASGHDVTLFASGDSITRAKLEAPIDYSLRLAPRYHDPLIYHTLMFERLARVARQFDIVHFHTDYLHMPFARATRLPHVTTLHGRLDLPDLVPLYREFIDMPLVSISDAQRTPLPWTNWRATVHHGLPEKAYQAGNGDGNYLAFLGRISPEKRVDHAIEIARIAGIPLRIAAKVDKVDDIYFRQVVEPLLDHPLVDFVGELDERAKNEFLGKARALLFPIDWPEPFGLVMIEAMACGTPVIAFRRGSVREIIEDGVNGFIVDDVDTAVRALARIDTIDRGECRLVFEERFSAKRMARDYVKVYEQVTRKGGDRRQMAREETN